MFLIALADAPILPDSLVPPGQKRCCPSDIHAVVYQFAPVFSAHLRLYKGTSLHYYVAMLQGLIA